MRYGAAVTDAGLVQRALVIGVAVAGTLGAVAGLVLGLRAYPPTAWFAVLEVGVPAALVGALLGVLVGLIGCAFRRAFRR